MKILGKNLSPKRYHLFSRLVAMSKVLKINEIEAIVCYDKSISSDLMSNVSWIASISFISSLVPSAHLIRQVHQCIRFQFSSINEKGEDNNDNDINDIIKWIKIQFFPIWIDIQVLFCWLHSQPCWVVNNISNKASSVRITCGFKHLRVSRRQVIQSSINSNCLYILQLFPENLHEQKQRKRPNSRIQT